MPYQLGAQTTVAQGIPVGEWGSYQGVIVVLYVGMTQGEILLALWMSCTGLCSKVEDVES